MVKLSALAEGWLDGEHVVVHDVAQANRLHNKAAAGTPQPGNTLRLARVEAAYCVAMGWLSVQAAGKPVAFASLLAAGPGDHRTDVDYLAYRDLRERGFVVRPATEPGRFDILPRGATQGPAAFQVAACADSDPVTGNALLAQAKAKLILAVVDGDGALTHYTLELAAPVGKVSAQPVPRAHGAWLADRVLVLDDAARAAYATQHLGTAHGNGTFLSLLEAAPLVEQGHLTLDDPAAFAKARTRLDPAVAATYHALRRAGVVAKSGFRFGTHLRGYPANPDDEHAPWLIHCTDARANLGWSTLSRGVRLAHGVRKEFLVAAAHDNAVAFLRLAWFRP